MLGMLFEHDPVRTVNEPGTRLAPGEGVVTDGVGSIRPPPSTSSPPSAGMRFKPLESGGSRVPSSGV